MVRQDDPLLEQGASYFTTPGKIFSSFMEGSKKLLFGGGSENQVLLNKSEIVSKQTVSSSMNQRDLRFQ